jgi:2-keto-4-pentenoate hydratase/2-oxohepta-3-ene-1,7-dioic acid hydratase in catechol pathway
MNIINFNNNRYGLILNNQIFDLTNHIKTNELLEVVQFIKNRSSSEIDSLIKKSETYSLNNVKINSPIINPGKVVAAPINYKAHIQEMQENGQAFGHIITDIKKAGLFLKASSSVVGPSNGIHQIFLDRRTDHEVELCAVIGSKCKNIKKEKALEYVLGYCLGLDITLRGPEDRSFRKSIDTYTVLGPWLTLPSEEIDPTNIDLFLSVNGQSRQCSNTSDMVLSLAEIIEYASQFYSLEPGDVIMSGTPQGVGPIVPGDLVFVKGTHLGEMNVNVYEGVSYEQ